MKKMIRRLGAMLCTIALCATSASALTVEQAIGLLEEKYIDELPAAAYEAETLDELFTAIGDPYTYYMNAEEYAEFNASVESETTITGIGAGIEYTADGIRITSVLSGGGAEEAGLTPGDLIIAIEGVSCAPAGEQHRALIIGDEGTFVNIRIRHENGTEQDYRIERRTVTLHNTTVTFEDGVGYIDCDSFGSQTGDYFIEGVSEYEDDARIWVVDLRSNTGGFADAAVVALGVFSGFGPKLFYRTSDGSSFHSLYLADQLTEKPAIALVNGYTASASEILSGGMRAQASGIIIGSRTYGKGTAQIVLDKRSHPDLFDDDSLKVTVYRFYCADGNTTDKIGVLPTLYVSDQYVDQISELLCADQPAANAYLRFHLNGYDFYIDLAKARTEQYHDAFNELIAALPPDVSAYCVREGVEAPLDSALAAQFEIPMGARAFNDLASSAYATEINTLGAYGILNGVGGGRFDPSRTLTRAELCAMLAQALNTTNKSGSFFSDVTAERWYSGDVNAMASLGFVNGVGDGRFNPNGTLSQEQFIAVMGRLTAFLNFRADDYVRALTAEELSDASLASLSAWARPGASVLTGYAGDMLYTPLSEIDPKAPVTREQAAATLCRVLKGLRILSY